MFVLIFRRCIRDVLYEITVSSGTAFITELESSRIGSSFPHAIGSLYSEKFQTRFTVFRRMECHRGSSSG